MLLLCPNLEDFLCKLERNGD